jgi:hypothetical protein
MCFKRATKIDCRDGCSIGIVKMIAGQINSDDYKEEFIYLNAIEIGLDIITKTPHKQFQEFLEHTERTETKENIKKLMVSVWVAIKEATKDGIDKVYNKEPEWSNLMDDIFIFYALRWILFKKPVPLVLPSDVDKTPL